MISPAPVFELPLPSADFSASLSTVFDQAETRWRALGADPQRWTDPQGRRELAAAFLRYHAVKLAMEEA
jgi:hypothetical protein